MTKRVRVAVVGVGYFGRFHAKHYAANPNAELVAVADTDAGTGRAVAREFGCEAVADYRQLIGRIDAASIAAPTPEHFGIARDLMAAGVHVLIEKPMTDDLTEARKLADLAAKHKRVLQVGHIERFSACYRALSELVKRPLYIESNRIAPWRERGTAVDVIFDLMIHDIDIIMGLVGSSIVSVSAAGTPLFSSSVDLASARVSFASGCIANVTASRVSHKTERSMRVFQPNGYHVCDFVKSRIFSYSVRGDMAKTGAAAIARQNLIVPKEDSLANEIDEFLECVRNGRGPAVDAQAGCEAVRVASMIHDSIREHRERIAAAQACAPN